MPEPFKGDQIGLSDAPYTSKWSKLEQLTGCGSASDVLSAVRVRKVNRSDRKEVDRILVVTKSAVLVSSLLCVVVLLLAYS